MFVGLLEALPRHVGVDFGGAEVAMSQKFLYGVDVGALVEQMGGEAVTEYVWTYPVGF